MGRLFMCVKQKISRRGAKVGPLAILHNVTYDKTTYIGFMAKLERTEIGKCTTIGSLSAVYDAKVGNFCSIARDVYIGGASHPLDWVSTSACFYLKNNLTGVCYHEADYQWHKETVIGNDVWIGAKSIIKAGVKIGDGAVIGGGSVVTKDVGPYEIWAGNPARLIRKRFDEDTVEILLKSKWWNWEEEKIRSIAQYFNDPSKMVTHLKNQI